MRLRRCDRSTQYLHHAEMSFRWSSMQDVASVNAVRDCLNHGAAMSAPSALRQKLPAETCVSECWIVGMFFPCISVQHVKDVGVRTDSCTSQRDSCTCDRQTLSSMLLGDAAISEESCSQVSAVNARFWIVWPRSMRGPEVFLCHAAHSGRDFVSGVESWVCSFRFPFARKRRRLQALVHRSEIAFRSDRQRVFALVEIPLRVIPRKFGLSHAVPDRLATVSSAGPRHLNQKLPAEATS